MCVSLCVCMHVCITHSHSPLHVPGQASRCLAILVSQSPQVLTHPAPRPPPPPPPALHSGNSLWSPLTPSRSPPLNHAPLHVPCRICLPAASSPHPSHPPPMSLTPPPLSDSFSLTAACPGPGVPLSCRICLPAASGPRPPHTPAALLLLPPGLGLLLLSPSVSCWHAAADGSHLPRPACIEITALGTARDSKRQAGGWLGFLGGGGLELLLPSPSASCWHAAAAGSRPSPCTHEVQNDAVQVLRDGKAKLILRKLEACTCTIKAAAHLHCCQMQGCAAGIGCHCPHGVAAAGRCDGCTSIHQHLHNLTLQQQQ